MPRKRDPRRDEARNRWLESKGDMKLVDLAKEFNVTSSTIRKWKSIDKWGAELKGSAPIPKKSAPKQKGGQPGNKNAKGHGAPKQNSNAVKHGLFAKYLPKETLEIVYHMDGISPVDLIWANIELLFAQIIRAQRIMHVEDKDEMIKELKKVKFEVIKTKEGIRQVPIEEELEFQFAWDRQASFLQAQARAMTTLQGLFRQFDETANRDDERRLKLKQMQLDVDKKKLEIDKLQNNENEGDAIDDWLAAMGEVDGQD